MATQNELIERGDKLAEKYSIDELKDALKNSIVSNDNEERLSIQWALKKKEKSLDGYKYTLEQTEKMNTKLEV